MKRRQKIRKTIIIIMFILFPVTIFYFSPILLIEGAVEGVLSGSAIVFALLFFSSLFVGRGFCGWVCPGGGLQEIVGRIRKKGVRRQCINWIKFLIWVPWLITVLYLILATGGIEHVDFFYMTHNGISVTDMQSFTIFLIVVFLFALLALTVGRRAACHTICWMAPFMILGRKVRNIFSWPALQLTADSEACIQCGQCSNTCPMGIEVMALVQTRRLENDDCILCASCADVCPRRVIHVSLARGVSS